LTLGARAEMQYLPFADVKALAVYDTFERGAYQLVSVER
jgi:methyl acetate hydrolase